MNGPLGILTLWHFWNAPLAGASSVARKRPEVQSRELAVGSYQRAVWENSEHL